ncbi:SRPBCC family protein [Arsenicicoccus dermatophilus]|uniref:SRPBCC family protein n=1 Tax=Arsenicicoccus dermatophilus TaxID=1076331 RepID=UPI0039176371
MQRRITVTGPVAVDEAWERYADLRLWSRWAPQIVGVEAGSHRLQAGLTGLVRGPAGIAVRFRVEEVEPAARTWRWTAGLLGVRVRMRHDLTADGSGTTAGLDLDGPAVVALAYPPVAALALRRLVARDLS